MKKILFLFLAATLFWSACKPITNSDSTTALDESESMAALDSVNLAFETAWNRKDSAAVVDMFAEDIIMISGKAIWKGKAELASNFVSRNMPVANDLKIKREKTDASGNLGYETGTWSLKVKLPDQPEFDQTGNHTFIWNKDNTNHWKLSIMDMEDHIPETK